jgi:hypothetical protein
LINPIEDIEYARSLIHDLDYLQATHKRRRTHQLHLPMKVTPFPSHTGKRSRTGYMITKGRRVAPPAEKWIEEVSTGKAL